jgi:hypothetical protein
MGRLLDHLIRPREHIRRDRQADLLGGFQVDNKLELCRLLDGKVAGLAPFKILSTYVAARRNRFSKSVPYDIKPPSVSELRPYITGSIDLSRSKKIFSDFASTLPTRKGIPCRDRLGLDRWRNQFNPDIAAWFSAIT